MESLPHRSLTLAILVAIAMPAGAHAAAVKDAKDLEGIKKKIETEKKGLNELAVKEGSVRKSLGKIESDLGKKTKELKTAAARYSSLVSEIHKKQAEADKLNQEITQREDLLKKRAVALYRWQRSGSSLGALNGDVDFATLQRRSRYFAAVISFDRDVILKLQEEGRRQEVLRAELAQKKDELAERKQVLGLAQIAVSQEAEKKKTLLASLRQEKTGRVRALRDMEAAAQRLQKMLDAIVKRTVIRPRESPSLPSSGNGLDAQRGRLEWPVKGDVSAPFGKFQHPEFAAEIIRNGIEIDTPVGENVRSVENGRVVFADRFSGFTKMVIVDHGERYYTIYGHLAEIYKKNGDDISRGDILGKVDNGASPNGAKLYFEIRKDGKSTDPIPWLRKR